MKAWFHQITKKRKLSNPFWYIFMAAQHTKGIGAII